MPKLEKTHDSFFGCALPKIVDEALRLESKARGISISRVGRSVLTAWAIGRGYLPPDTEIQ